MADILVLIAMFSKNLKGFRIICSDFVQKFGQFSAENFWVICGESYAHVVLRIKSDTNFGQDCVKKIMQNTICIELLSIIAKFDRLISTRDVPFFVQGTLQPINLELSNQRESK